MTRSIMTPFSKFSKEADTIGRLLAGYSNIEMSLFHAVYVATGDFDTALKKIFGIRNGTRRIKIGEQLGLGEYRRLNLASDFGKALRIMRYCLKIRNQYAHWVWWDDYTGKLAFTNVEDLTKYKRKVNDLQKLKAHHVDDALLKAQEAYFVYADELLLWVNYEGRFKRGEVKQNPLNKPKGVKRPNCACRTATDALGSLAQVDLNIEGPPGGVAEHEKSPEEGPGSWGSGAGCAHGRERSHRRGSGRQIPAIFFFRSLKTRPGA
jgi:hypothetical protein